MNTTYIQYTLWTKLENCNKRDFEIYTSIKIKTIMLLFLVLIIVNTCRTQPNTGTTLFYNKQFETDCWNEEDLAKLRARMVFNQLLPRQTTPDRMNKKFINEAIRYYRRALLTVDKQGYSHTRTILKETLVDTVGGHLRSELLPTARFAYYAGYVPYRPVRELHEFYDELKLILNTEGRGWRRPARTQLTNLTVVKIMIGPGKLFNPCNCLVVQRDTNSCIRLPTPRVDDENEPSAVALPFKHGGLVNLLSPKSENILLKYYTTAARCILSSSPESCRHPDFVNFNNDLWHWMKRDVAPHLMDEKLYAAYGGVFRIAAAVQNYGRGLSRRNLFQFYPSSNLNKWQPWKTLTQSYISVNTDWSPGLCVTFVVLAALSICCLQIIFNYFFGNKNGCHCVGPNKPDSKQVAYTNIDSSFPAMLPGSNIYDSKSKGSRRTMVQSKNSTMGAIKTQRVYDFHEKCDQFMDVVMSDAEGDDSTSTDSGAESNENDDENYVIEGGKMASSKSPPKIESSIAQLTINKSGPQSEMYSSSAVEGAAGAAGAGAASTKEQWTWSESGESASGGSSSSSGSRPRTRDLAWARRLLSNSRIKTNSGTEFDRNSYTTPTSHRYS